MHINDLICAPMLNQENTLMGMVTLEYSFNNRLDIDNLDISDIETETKVIAALLELNRKK
jgi:hypothetical protein